MCSSQHFRGLLSAFIWLCLANAANSQVSDTELCACSPRVYELTFDFSLKCEPVKVDTDSGGIESVTCHVAGFDNINVTDLVPVAVSSVQLIEIGQNGGPAAVAQETGDFRDGSTVTYTSISFEGAVAPRAFQVRALGRNAAGEPLVMQWAVTYSNNCGVWPVLDTNDSVGWTIFTGLAEPLNIVCPAVSTDPPTAPPTTPPTGHPTAPPTAPPSGTPTASPTAPVDPVRGGGVGGDPHFKTWAGQYYDFHGQCKLLFMDAPSFGGGKGLTIQIETEIRGQYSFISNAVVAIGKPEIASTGNDILDHYDVLEVSGFGQYQVNGVGMAALPMQLSDDYTVSHSQPSEKSHSFTINFGDKQELRLSTWKDWVSISVNTASKKDFGNSVGLMGSWDDGSMLSRNKTTIIDDPVAFGKEWKLLPTDVSFFQSLRAPNDPNECVMPVVAKSGRRRLGESFVSKEEAEDACGHWKDKDHFSMCVYDVTVSGDLEAAHAGFV